MPDVSDRDLRARSFGGAADVYARARPGYPAAAIDWLVPAGARRVLDLGAGSGQLTSGLVDRGLDVVAVEPSEAMRRVLGQRLPQVRALSGSAEAIPLPDGACDAVVVGQAWHWVDPARAVPEVARVLARGGSLGLVWNLRDERVDWVAELGRILHGPERQSMGAENPRVGLPFGPVQRFDTTWVQELTADGLLELAASRSYVITLPEAERARRLERVRELLAGHPALAGSERVALPYVTRCSRAELLSPVDVRRYEGDRRRRRP